MLHVCIYIYTCYCVASRRRSAEGLPRHARLAMQKGRTTEINTSEITVDLQWHVSTEVKLHVPKDCHLSSGCLLELSTGCSVACSNGYSLL